MKYAIGFKPTALNDLKKLDRQEQKNIIGKIELMQNNLSGDIKRLTDFTPEYRLRVGNYRILFEVEDGTVMIYRVKHRKEAYR